ncbi:unnamed protein product [Prorocentrum cordatum]|uniref:Uncharacterized protein n=1 Tax=Prorocentrum cordatum TaxID=2364126 RepID=A0ABN9VMX0_9DINO|nr:unnamed protein product [Polarella glacialis]
MVSGAPGQMSMAHFGRKKFHGAELHSAREEIQMSMQLRCRATPCRSHTDRVQALQVRGRERQVGVQRPRGAPLGPVVRQARDPLDAAASRVPVAKVSHFEGPRVRRRWQRVQASAAAKRGDRGASKYHIRAEWEKNYGGHSFCSESAKIARDTVVCLSSQLPARHGVVVYGRSE